MSVLILSLGLFLASNVSAKSFREATVAGVKVLAEDIQSVRLDSKAILTQKGKEPVRVKSICDKGQGEVSNIQLGSNCEIHLPNGDVIFIEINAK